MASKIPFLLFILALLAPLPGLAQCEDAESAKTNVLQLDQDIEQLIDLAQNREVVRKKQIEEIAVSLIKRGKWTEQDKAAFFISMMTAPEILAMEAQKKPMRNSYMLATKTMILLKNKQDFKTACQNAAEIRFDLAKISEINLKEYDWLLEKIRSIDTAK